MAVDGRSQMSNKPADKEEAEAVHGASAEAHKSQNEKLHADRWPKDSMSNTRSSVRMPCLPVHFDGRPPSSCRRT